MTLLQAMERTDWSLRISSVEPLASTFQHIAPFACEVCDNERQPRFYVAVRDDATEELYLVYVGKRCYADLRTVLP